MSNSTSKVKDLANNDKLLSKLLNIGTVVLFFAITIAIYFIFFHKTKIADNFISEPFNPTTTAQTVAAVNTTQQPTANISNVSGGSRGDISETIYENAIKVVFGDNKRLLCSMIPKIGTNMCVVDGTSYVIYNFPVHMIKLLDNSILAVFNDGRLYRKDDIFNTMWQGPLNNSLPNDSVPLRMITMSPDLKTLLGIGYDNKLYKKQPDANGNINYTNTWRLVPNNYDIIYVLFDNDTGYLISIDTKGKLFIKTSSDLTSANVELINRLDRPVLRLYYDINGYMLAIDTNFDLYQFSELNWKNSPLNLQRGANASKLQDILYHNDGRLFGLVFNQNKYMVQIMKQEQPFYLGDFTPLDQHINLNNNGEFVMSDQDIILSKVGNIKKYLEDIDALDASDNDPNIAYQKQIMETRSKLKSFCANRSSTANANYDNYDLLANVEQNDDRIMQLKDIINNLITYEPEKERIIEKYPILENN